MDHIGIDVHKKESQLCILSEDGAEALRLGPDAPLDDLAALGENVDLAFPLVHVDANMVHGWPLLTAALTEMALSSFTRRG